MIGVLFFPQLREPRRVVLFPTPRSCVSFPVVFERRPPKAWVKYYGTDIRNGPKLAIVLIELHPSKIDMACDHRSALLAQAAIEVLTLLELLQMCQEILE